jgi:hypothetical protein
LPARGTLEDHLVGVDLETDVDEALEPDLERVLADEVGGERAVAGEAESDVLSVAAEQWTVVAFAQSCHVAAENQLGEPREHAHSSLRSFRSGVPFVLEVPAGADVTRGHTPRPRVGSG